VHYRHSQYKYPSHRIEVFQLDPSFAIVSHSLRDQTYLNLDIRVFLESGNRSLPTTGTFDDDGMGWQIYSNSQSLLLTVSVMRSTHGSRDDHVDVAMEKQ
jgi:hypothetical protein